MREIGIQRRESGLYKSTSILGVLSGRAGGVYRQVNRMNRIAPARKGSQSPVSRPMASWMSQTTCGVRYYGP